MIFVCPFHTLNFLSVFARYVLVISSGEDGLTDRLNHQQIQDTIRVMNHNVQAATQRGENVNTLQNKTDDLREASRGFYSSAKRARRQMFKKNVWMTILVIIGILIVIGIIVGIGESMCISKISFRTPADVDYSERCHWQVTGCCEPTVG